MTKRRNIADMREKKRDLWIKRTEQVTGKDTQTVQNLLSTPRTQSLRPNPLRTHGLQGPSLQQGWSLQTTRGDLGGEKVERVEEICWDNGVRADESVVGYSCSQEQLSQLRDSELVENGEVYIQNASSWLPVLALDPQPNDVILDVCAAPGGKASHIQAITGNQSKLTCNDNSKPRLMKLQRNMERLGAEASYTLCDATRLSRSAIFSPPVITTVATRSDLVATCFDRILVDAPCSGEGLMTLDDMKLFDSWSVAHIRRLSDLQKKILSESWQLLKPGGTLVYSTCTMAPEENEAVIDYFLRKNPDATLETLDFPLENRISALSSWNNKPFANDLSPCLRLLPSKLTEAFFVAKIVKSQ